MRMHACTCDATLLFQGGRRGGGSFPICSGGGSFMVSSFCCGEIQPWDGGEGMSMGCLPAGQEVAIT